MDEHEVSGEEMKTLRELREASGMTQFEVAQKLGVTITSVYNWERGAAEPFARHLLALARLYDVSPFAITLPEVKPTKRGKAWRQRELTTPPPLPPVGSAPAAGGL